MTIEHVKNALEILQYIAVIFGIPIALIQYISSTRKERKDREYETYNSLDEKFIDYLKLCLDHPDLDVFDISDSTLNDTSLREKKTEIIIFTILFSVFERAYTMYHDKSKTVKKQQWSGWKEYIIGFSERKNFAEAWEISGETFHKKFQDYMNKKIFKKE